jgi:hypothetical protein
MKFTRYRLPEFVYLIFWILGFSTIYGYVSDDDYHKAFDIPQIVRYNCDMLIGGWHPDVPLKVIEECRKKKSEDAKTY